MRILVTNDDGVGAPGLAALTRALVAWAEASGTDGPGPSTRSSSWPRAPTSAAPAPPSAPSRTAPPSPTSGPASRGAEGVEAYGLDASPALSVIAGALGAVGPKPDLVLSGINHGVNVGRSVLHSGTVGAALDGQPAGHQRAGRVAARSGAEPDPWESAADLAVALLPLLAAAPPRTVLNLNVPHLPLAEIRGVRWARVSGAGLIKAGPRARDPGRRRTRRRSKARPRPRPPGRSWRASPRRRVEIVLTVGSPFPHSGDLGLADCRRRGRHPGRPGLRRPHRAAGPAGRGGPRAAGPARPGPGAGARGLRLQRLTSGCAVVGAASVLVVLRAPGAASSSARCRLASTRHAPASPWWGGWACGPDRPAGPS